MIAAGVNAKALSTYMGHASVVITYDLYGHLMPATKPKPPSSSTPSWTAHETLGAPSKPRGTTGRHAIHTLAPECKPSYKPPTAVWTYSRFDHILLRAWL
jgi:hypothetical protein